MPLLENRSLPGFAVAQADHNNAANAGLPDGAPAPASVLEPREFQHPFGPDEWRGMADQIADFVANYYRQLLAVPSNTRVQPPPTLEPGFLREKLPEAPPQQPEPFEAVMKDIADQILPGLLHWQHPCMFGYYSLTTSFPAIAADLLSSGLGTLGFQWTSSPAMTELEVGMLDWMVHLLGLPGHFLSYYNTGAGAALLTSASEVVLVSLVAARAKALAGRPIEDSVRLVAYCSDQAHSCVQKAGMIGGIYRYRVIPTTAADDYALRPEALEQAIKEDEAAGLLPFWAAATIGTTSSCAVDPVSELVDVCAAHGVWLHVDAAYAGNFAMLPELRARYFQGVDKVDSYGTNPHKGMLTGWECAALFVRDARWVKNAMALTPEYLKPPGRGEGGALPPSFCSESERNETDGAVAPKIAKNGDLRANGAAAAASAAAAAAGAKNDGKIADGIMDGACGLSFVSEAPEAGVPRCGSNASTHHPHLIDRFPDYKDWEVALGSPFRPLKLWLVLRMYGTDNMRAWMRHRLLRMERLLELLEGDDRFSLVDGAPPRMALVCFRLKDGSEEQQEALLQAVNATGRAFIMHTKLEGRYVLRMSLGGTFTRVCDVEMAWRVVQEAARNVLAAGKKSNEKK